MPDWPMMICAAAGVVVTSLLAWGLTETSGLPYCGADSGCDIVQSSAWSMFLGVPLALWGLGFYVLLVLLVIDGRRRHRFTTLTPFLVTVGFFLSVYFAAVSAFVINAWCVYCLTSLVILTVAFALTWRRRYRGIKLKLRAAGLVTAVALAAAMHAGAVGLFWGTDPADPYLLALARHLGEREIKFYGASWCPHCQQQKDIFGTAADQLPYVECAPRGPRGPRATECEVKEIRNYPTWIIDGRPLARVLTPEKLALVSGFKSRSNWAAETEQSP